MDSFTRGGGEAEFPIGPSPGRHDFRSQPRRKSCRPPSPRSIGRGCGADRAILDPSVAQAAPPSSRHAGCARSHGNRRAATPPWRDEGADAGMRFVSTAVAGRRISRSDPHPGGAISARSQGENRAAHPLPDR